MSLKQELALRNDFKHRPHEALLNVYYTAAKTQKKADEFFRLHGLTDVQFNVLMLLRSQSGDRGGLTQVELSRMMLVNRANITTLIDRMQRAKLVVRVADPEDRRFNIIKMTPKGESLYDKVSALYQRKVRDIMSALSDAEQADLMAKLGRLRKKLETVPLE